MFYPQASEPKKLRLEAANVAEGIIILKAAADLQLQQPAANASSGADELCRSPLFPPLPIPLHLPPTYPCLKPCTICKTLTNFTCAECKEIFYCSKECRGNDYSFHRRNCRRIARPYVYHQPSRAFEGITFSVSHFMKGPDQPLDPPDTEAYEDMQHLWRYCWLIIDDESTTISSNDKRLYYDMMIVNAAIK